MTVGIRMVQHVRMYFLMHIGVDNPDAQRSRDGMGGSNSALPIERETGLLEFLCGVAGISLLRVMKVQRWNRAGFVVADHVGRTYKSVVNADR